MAVFRVRELIREVQQLLSLMEDEAQAWQTLSEEFVPLQKLRSWDL